MSELDSLRHTARALELVLAIDRIRDSAADERELTTGIVSTLADATEAELCLLCLRDDDTGELQLRAVLDRAAVYSEPAAQNALRRHVQQAASLPAGQVLQTSVAVPGRAAYHCLAAPLRLGADSLGALLLLNAERAFDPNEQLLVRHAISQIDSALQHARTLRDLQRRQRELEIIYRIDRLRDQQPDFQALLDSVLAEVVGTLNAETGFLMLFDRLGNELELRACSGRDLFGAEEPAGLIRAAAEDAVRVGEMVVRAYPDGPVRSLVGVPLILRSKLIGVLGVVNSAERPRFGRSDLQMLRAIASQMDTAIFESLQTQRLRGAFGLCVGPQVMERLLAISDRDLLTSERRSVTTVFSDIRGFTHMAEHIAPELLQSVLNDHLSALTDLVLAYEGTLDKYVGDSVMCFFNAPEDQPDHASRAVRLALDMQRAHRDVMERWRHRIALPPIGIGISTGETMMGNFGSLRRLEYTAIGRDVNLAARLCAAADGGQILISERTYRLVQPLIEADELEPVRLKGIEGGVRCWHVRAAKSHL